MDSRGVTRGKRVLLAMAALAAGPALAQDLEPRRWSPLPDGVNYAGALYSFTDAEVFFDPVLELEDVTLDLQTAAAKYLRTFNLLSYPARAELLVPWQDAHWKGLLQGQAASRRSQGLADPRARLAVNLMGPPSLDKKAFARYRAEHPVDTVLGVGLTVQAPLGVYNEERLLNIGDNRFVFRPEIGMEHTRGRWGGEITGSTSFFTDNDEFFNGNHREQDPVHLAQAHVHYTFRPGLWLGAGALYGWGGASTVNGVAKHDERENLILGMSLGLPVTRAIGAKLAYLRSETQVDSGSDSDTMAVAVSALW